LQKDIASKGGKNSYKAYQPLRDKTVELCKQELGKRQYQSALQLSHTVASIIEARHKSLLEVFSPYKKQDGTDWRQGTFYNWCNKSYKSFK